MSKRAANELYKKVEAACKATGLAFVIENGGIHYKVILAGRLVGVFSKGAHAGRGIGASPAANVVAAIRRAARGVGA